MAGMLRAAALYRLLGAVRGRRRRASSLMWNLLSSADWCACTRT